MKIKTISDIKDRLSLLETEDKIETTKKLVEPIFNYLELQGIDPFLVIQNMFLMLSETNAKRFIFDAQSILNLSKSDFAMSEKINESVQNAIHAKINDVKNDATIKNNVFPSTKDSFIINSSYPIISNTPIQPIPVKNLLPNTEKVKETMPPTILKSVLTSPIQSPSPYIDKNNTVEVPPSFPSIKNTNYSGLKINDNITSKSSINQIQEQIYENLTLNEGIKYLIPFLTEKGNTALKDPKLTNEEYSLLKLVNGIDTLEEINEKNFAQINNNFIFSLSAMKNIGFPSEFIISFISRIIALHSKGFISFSKKKELSTTKKFNIRLGELLLYMKVVDDEKLEKALEVQKSWKPQKATLSPSKPMLGNLLLSLEIVGQGTLNQALEIQKWYNSLQKL